MTIDTIESDDDTSARRRVTAASARHPVDDAAACAVVDPDAARTMAEQARLFARSAADPATEAKALLQRAELDHRARRVDEAFSAALEARELAADADAAAIEVDAIGLLARLHVDAGNFTDALAAALHALERHRMAGLAASEGPLLATIAGIHEALGDTDRAVATYDSAIAANGLLGRDDLDVEPLAGLARTRAARNEHLLAINSGESALVLARRCRPVLVPRVLAQLSASYCASGALEQAEACLAEAELMALDGFDAADAAMSQTMLAFARGDLDRNACRPTAAAEHYRRALTLAVEHGMIEVELRAHTSLAAVYKVLGRFEEALHHQELRFERHQQLFSHGADLRVKTLQIAHDTAAARQQAEILRLRTGELEALVRGRTYDLEEYQLEAFERLAVIAEFRDTDTGEHTVRVGDLAALVTRELGESEEYTQQIRLAGRLHDIGKVAVPDSILLHPGRLTAEQFEVMKTHTTVGAEILSGSSSPLIQLAAQVALNHHERWDGTGYPSGLLGEEIPLPGRIVAVADVFDALTSERPYKRAWSRAEAVQHIADGSGSHFEPRIVEAFLRVIGRSDPELGPVGPDDAQLGEARVITVPEQGSDGAGVGDPLGVLVAELARSAERAEQAVVRLEQPVMWADEPVVWGADGSPEAPSDDDTADHEMFPGDDTAEHEMPSGDDTAEHEMPSGDGTAEHEMPSGEQAAMAAPTVPLSGVAGRRRRRLRLGSITSTEVSEMQGLYRGASADDV